MKAIILCLFFISQCSGVEQPAEAAEIAHSFNEEAAPEIIQGPAIKLPEGSPEIKLSNSDELQESSEPQENQLPPSNSSNEYDAADCPFKCTDESKNKFGNDQDFIEFLAKLEKPLRFKDQFLPKHLSKYCEMNSNTKECIKSCPESKYKVFILEGLNSQSICTDGRMLKEDSKFNQVFNNKLDECTKTCSIYGNNLTEIVNVPESNLTRTEILDISCNYLLCFTNCERDALMNEVGKEDTKYYEKLVANTIKFSRASAEVNGEKLEFPETCQQVEKLGKEEYAPVDSEEEELPPKEEGSEPAN